MIERVAVFDTGAGNLHSLTKAIAKLLPNRAIEVVDSAPDRSKTLLVLPGVGAFAPAAARLANARDAICSAILDGLPTIGICLGMQLLFESSEEGEGAGIGAIRGAVTKLRAPRLPHMGWSAVDVAPECGWLRAATPSALYFAHSYACRPTDPACVLATTRVEGDAFPTVVRVANAIGCQFHPEKSSFEGVAMLGAIIEAVSA